jgi:plasmid stabilization system protein ParE
LSGRGPQIETSNPVLEHLEGQSPRAASRLIESVLEAIGLLGANPEMGPPSTLEPRGRYRQLLIERRYLVIYRTDRSRTVILRFWDARQDPARLAAHGEE